MPTNYEWLLHMDGEERQSWFDAEHVDDLGQIADMSQKSADCVRNDGKMSETGVSANDVDANDDLTHKSDVIAADVDANYEKATQDSREKLEADVSKWCLSHAYGDTGYTFIIKQLNRQAAITRKTEQAAWIQQANGLIHEANVERDELRGSLDTAKQLIEQYKADGVDNLRKIDELRNELAKRDKGIARLKRQRDEARQELEKNRWEYCETCEHAEHVDRLEAECDKLKRKEKQLSNELGLRDKAIEMLLDVKQELIAERDALRAENMALKADSDECVPRVIKKRDEVIKILKTERDALAADLRDCEQQRERLRQALGMAIDHAHEIVSLVTLDGEVIG